MESKVYSTETVLVTQDYSADDEIKLIRKVPYLITKGKGLLAKSTSGKTEFRLWLTEVENFVKKAENLENKASGRDLRGKMKELDELYKKVELAESLAAEENAGETSQGKLDAEENAGEANEGGKMAVMGMGGVGKVRLENEEAVNMTFGEISVAEENAGEKSPKKKNSSKSVVGMGGVGDTDIKNKGAVTMTFGNIKM